MNNKVWSFDATLTIEDGVTDIEVFIQRLVSAPPEWGYKRVRVTVLDYLRDTYKIYVKDFRLHSVTECKSQTHLISQLICLDARSQTTCQLSEEQVADALTQTTPQTES